MAEKDNDQSTQPPRVPQPDGQRNAQDQGRLIESESPSRYTQRETGKKPEKGTGSDRPKK